jgi:hypothetical protein
LRIQRRVMGDNVEALHGVVGAVSFDRNGGRPLFSRCSGPLAICLFVCPSLHANPWNSNAYDH